jgi:hypothetical protein
LPQEKTIRRTYIRGIQVKVMKAQQFQRDVETPRMDRKLMKKNLIVLALVMSTASLAAAEEKDLTGVWEVKISPTGVPPPPMLALAIFGEDGSFIGTHDRAVPPVPEIQAVAAHMGPAYGRWIQTDDREFQLTFYAAMWNKEGIISGFHRIQASIVLSESGDEFTAKTQADFFDTNWETLFTNTGEVKGTRLKTPEEE